MPLIRGWAPQAPTSRNSRPSCRKRQVTVQVRAASHPQITPELAPICAFAERWREGGRKRGKDRCLSWAHLSTSLCTETGSALAGKLAAGSFPEVATSPRQWPALLKPTSPCLPLKPAPPQGPSKAFPTVTGMLGRATNSTRTNYVNPNILSEQTHPFGYAPKWPTQF